MRAAGIFLLLCSGCWDFDRLLRERDDLAAPADLGAPDLTAPGDLAENDLAPPDLEPPADLGPQADLVALPDLTICGPYTGANDDGGVLYVGISGTSDAGASPSAPFGTVGAALAAAAARGGRWNLLIESGSYDETVVVSAPVSLWGGYHSAFTCRDALSMPTRITGTTNGEPAVLFTAAAGGVTLDGMTVVGKAAAGVDAIAVKVEAADVTVRGCDLISHEPLPSPTANAAALRAEGVFTRVISSQLRSGAASSTSSALHLCSARGDVTDSHLEAVNSQPMGITISNGILVQGSCGAFPANPVRTIVRNSLIIANTTGALGDYAHGAEVSDALELRGSVVQVSAPLEATALSGGTLVVQGSTLVVVNPGGGTANTGLFSNGPASFTVGDSLIIAPVPIWINANQTTYAATGNNWFLSAAASRVAFVAPSTDYAIADLRTLAPFNDANARAGDPMLAADNIHLTAGSPLVDQAAGCAETSDIDGQGRPRPTGGQCDIGADEL